jgi:YVTN family beta-propeller protein
MQVDVSGDSEGGVTPVGIGPSHATLQASGAISQMWVANTLADSLSVFTPSTANPLSTIGAATTVSLPSGSAPAFVNSTESGAMYVANSGNDTVGVINTTPTPPVLVATIPVGTAPVALAETPDATRLYVANSGSNSVTSISPADRTVRATIAVSPSPQWAVARSDSARVYVLSTTAGVVTTIDPLTDNVLSTLPVGAGATYLYYDSRRNRLYVPLPNGTVGIYDATVDPPALLATIDLTTTIPGTSNSPCPASGCSAASVAALPDGTRAYIASFYVDSNTANCQQIVGQVAVSCIAVQVTVINALTNLMTTAINLPEFAVSSEGNCASARFRVSATAAADSSRVYVASCDDGAVAVINTSANRFVVSLPAPLSSFPPVETCTPGQNCTCPAAQPCTCNPGQQCSPPAPPRQNTLFLLPGP